ncbi:MAG: flavodoxin domain-containing protein [Candidatus Bathyarchaeia archaeon]
MLRVLIAYYSKTGNTEKISNAVKQALESNCEVDVLKIEMVREYSSTLPHLNPRVLLDTFLNRKPRIRSLQDMSPYDVICVGTPNWYGRIAPPVSTFIKEMTNAEGKKAIAFVSSGLGRESYAKALKNRLEKKSLKVLKTLSLILGEISESQLTEIVETATTVNQVF